MSTSPPAAPKHHQIKEVIKCGRDTKYFVNKYIKIQHPKRGLLPFNTYDFQDDIIDAYHEHRFNIIVKSRQLGISTITAAYALWLAIFYRDKNIVCIATNLATAVEFMDKVKVAMVNLPQWLILKPAVAVSRQHVKFGNGSQIRAIPRSESAGRSIAASFVIIDEAAHIENFEKIWNSIFPTLSEGGSAVMLSSPNGASGLFYETYVKALEKKNEFNPIELRWDVHPDHDQKWYEKTKPQFSDRGFAQEYNCDFLGSGDTYVEPKDIEWLHSLSCDPIRRDGPAGQIWIWKDPAPGHEFVMSADVARGDGGGDFSAFHVIDKSSFEVVAEFLGHIRPDAFGKLLDQWGRHYNNALMCPEKNTFGHHTITVLMHRDYPNMYYEQREKNPSFYPGPEDIPGYTNSGKKKRNDLLVNLETLIRNKQLKVYSTRFVHQLQTFIWTQSKADSADGRATARKNSHDDLIISLAIGCSLLGTANIDTTNREIMYAILNTSHVKNTKFNYPESNYVSEMFSKAVENAVKNDNIANQPTENAESVPSKTELLRRQMTNLNWLM